MLIRGAIVFAVALIMMGPASAANLYSGKEIADAHRAMAPNIRLMVTEDIVRATPRTHRPAAAKVTVKFVDRGPHPLTFWALLREQRPLPAPLTAFGIDRSAALADSYMNDVSGIEAGWRVRPPNSRR